MVDLATPMAVRVVATLRIADHIARGLRTASELAEAVNVDPGALDPVLQHLAVKGVLNRDESGRYGLTARSEALREDHPSDLRGLLDIEDAIGRADLSFVHLLHSVRTGEPAFPVQFGRAFWDDLALDPSRTESYDAQMGSDIAADVPAIVSVPTARPCGPEWISGCLPNSAERSAASPNSPHSPQILGLGWPQYTLRAPCQSLN
jgi:hypothetical protein